MRGFRTEMCVDSQLWHEDSFELNGSEIRWQAKVCEKHSEFGIDGGRILKLWGSVNCRRAMRVTGRRLLLMTVGGVPDRSPRKRKLQLNMLLICSGELPQRETP